MNGDDRRGAGEKKRVRRVSINSRIKKHEQNPITTIKTMAVETPLVSVSFINPKKQRGLVAQVPIPSGSVIFSEQPLVCSQYLFNKDYFPSCSHCLKSLEAPNVMLTRLAGIQNDGLVNEMPFLNEFMAIPGNATPEISFCGHCRREMYCSEG